MELNINYKLKKLQLQKGKKKIGKRKKRLKEKLVKNLGTIERGSCSIFQSVINESRYGIFSLLETCSFGFFID